MQLKFKFFITLICLLISAQFLHSQRGLELGMSAGLGHYFGDLNPLYRLNEPGPFVSVISRFNFNTRLSIRGNLNYTFIRGNDKFSSNSFEKRRNLHFRSNIFELNPALEFNFFSYKHGSKTEFFTPYLAAGFSAFYYNPRAEYQNEWYNLRDLGTEGQLNGEEYNTVGGAWFLGFGFKMDITHTWSFNAELGLRKAFTDYLDDVSSLYPDYSELSSFHGPVAVALADPSIPDRFNQKIGVEGSQRGDSKSNDGFATFGVSLVYYFGGVRCPNLSIPIK